MSIQRSLFAVVGVSFIILVLSRLSGVEGIKCYTCSDCSNFTSNANGTIPTQFLMECKANETACVKNSFEVMGFSTGIVANRSCAADCSNTTVYSWSIGIAKTKIVCCNDKDGCNHSSRMQSSFVFVSLSLLFTLLVGFCF